MSFKSKKGFTLVELVIVIAILGIIAVIAVPSLTGVQKRSQVNADIRTAEQIGKAVRVWLTDATINQTRRREAYISTNKYIELSKIDADTVPSTTGTLKDNGLEEFISLTYAPNVADKEGATLAFYVGIINKKVVVAISTAATTPDLTGIKHIYELDPTTGVEQGIAYVEGVSNLNAETAMKALNMTGITE